LFAGEVWAVAIEVNVAQVTKKAAQAVFLKRSRCVVILIADFMVTVALWMAQFNLTLDASSAVSGQQNICVRW
jgi:hypothetical protein